MDFKQIQELIKLINKSDLAEVKIEQKDFRITIRSKEYAIAKRPADTTVAVPMHAPASAPAHTQQPQPAETQAKKEEAGGKQAPAEDTGKYVEIKSPMIGTFYRSSSPDKDPFIKVGDTIQQGDVVCIIEAMKLFNEIESEVSGKIIKVLVDNASPVEYDQPLFLVEPS